MGSVWLLSTMSPNHVWPPDRSINELKLSCSHDQQGLDPLEAEVVGICCCLASAAAISMHRRHEPQQACIISNV